MPIMVSVSRRSGGNAKLTDPNESIDVQYSWLILLTLGFVLSFFMLARSILALREYIRLLVCMTSLRQRYYVPPNALWAGLKRHLIYAPLIRGRHKREPTLSSARNTCTIPTRLQCCTIAALVAVNGVFCVVHIDWAAPAEDLFPIIRNRSGTLATVNLTVLILLAGRYNPLSKFLGLNFDAFNLVHRWLGRIVILESVVHTAMWLVTESTKSGWDAVSTSIGNNELILTGLIACIALISIGLISLSMIRHAFYDTFLHFHILLVCLALVGLWYHLREKTARIYLYAAIGIWTTQRSIRLLLLIWRNCGRSSTRATMKILPGEAMMVNLTIARTWNVRPGQHIFLYLPCVGLWTSHPFTVAWHDIVDDSLEKKELPRSRSDIRAARKTTRLHLVIRRRTGFTDNLYKRVEKEENQYTTFVALVEGPYGQPCQLESYGTVMLFAGGVGITHQLPHVRHLINSFIEGTVATRRISLIWVIRTAEHITWTEPWLKSLLNIREAKEILTMQIFITMPESVSEGVTLFPRRPNSELIASTSELTITTPFSISEKPNILPEESQIQLQANMEEEEEKKKKKEISVSQIEVSSPSSFGEGVQVFPGRPNIECMVSSEAETQIGSMAVSACGPGSMSDDVRRACRKYQFGSEIDYFEESFSW